MNPGLSYREAAVAGASPIRLVLLLYEQAMDDLRRACAGQRRGNIEERANAINHAILVIGHLEATLDRDRGGQVAANLQLFYQHVRAGLLRAQCQQSESELERQISLLLQVYDAWREVESSLFPSPVHEAPETKPESSEWNA